MIASWPGTIKAGVVSQDLIDFSDMLPTFAELGGGHVPQDRKVDGRSFLPQLKGEKGNPRDWVFCWYERNGRRQRASQHVRNQRYKLYADGRFFDVVKNPLERKPLAAGNLTEDQRAIRRRLDVTLQLKVAETKKIDRLKQFNKPAKSGKRKNQGKKKKRKAA